MKKLILLCAIVCTNQLYSMKKTAETETAYTETTSNWDTLPKDLQMLIIQVLYANDNPHEAIATLKKMSQTSKALQQLINEEHHGNKGFTSMINLIAKEFPYNTKKRIAEQFKTATARQYVEINDKLVYAVLNGDLNTVKQLIDDQNADPNYSWGTYAIQNIAELALDNVVCERPDAKAILQFLLEKGMSTRSPSQPFYSVDQHVSRQIPNEIQELLDQYKNQ